MKHGVLIFSLIIILAPVLTGNSQTLELVGRLPFGPAIAVSYTISIKSLYIDYHSGGRELPVGPL